MEFSSSINWKNTFIQVKPGQNLTLPCLYTGTVYARISWFKQTVGEMPKLICVYRTSSQTWTFYHDFKSNTRFNLHPHSKGINLTFANLNFSDSATYYCANQDQYFFEFIHGYNVIVEDSELTITQSPSESIQPGGSGTLNCLVHTGSCDMNHTVHWFKHSGPSQLELVYSHNKSRNECGEKTNTCFYSLNIKSWNSSHRGIYYCAVEACGRFLFGNGTKLDFEGE